jgi:16S rRNA (adenine(1408)-N(1))-methyltransferase
MDAASASMAEISRRAARAPVRGGRTNLLFVVAAAETPPVELLGVADDIRILFPWGSLLRGVLGRDERVVRGIAALARPGARVTATVSVTPVDGVGGIRGPPLDGESSRGSQRGPGHAIDLGSASPRRGRRSSRVAARVRLRAPIYGG